MGEASTGLETVVFISYAHEDLDVARQVHAHCKLSVVHGGYELFIDENLKPGYEWTPQLERKLERTVLALWLLSIDSLTSQFIRKREIEYLRSRGVPIMPIVVRPCAWDLDEIAKELHVLWGARDGERPLKHLEINDREQGLATIARAVASELVREEVTAEHKQIVLVDEQPVQESVPAAPTTRPGMLLGVPDRPTGLQPPPQHDEIKQALLRDRGSDDSMGCERLGLVGQGGLGKTLAALAVAHDLEIRDRFPDGVHWVTLGEVADVSIAQRQLVEQLRLAGADVPDPGLLTTESELYGALRAAFVDRRCLVIIDDVWSAAAAERLMVADACGSAMVTTRFSEVLTRLSARPVAIRRLSTERASAFLARALGMSALPEGSDTVIDACRGVVLSLALVGGALRSGKSWEWVTREFARAAEWYSDDAHQESFRAMRVAFSALAPSDAERYLDLVVLPDDVAVPIATVARYWHERAGLDIATSTGLLDRLAGLKLLAHNDGGVGLHDDQLHYLRCIAPDQLARHAALLRAHERLLRDPASWSTLPADEPYLWDQLVHHLEGAGDFAGVRRLAHDLGWVLERTMRSGPLHAELDLSRLAGQLVSDESATRLVRRIRQTAHLLAHASRDRRAAAQTLWALTCDLGIERGALQADLGAVTVTPRVAWPLTDGDEALERVMAGHEDSVRGLCSFLASNGEPMIATASLDETVRIWKPEHGRQVGELRGHTGAVRDVCTFVSGKGDLRIASVGDDAMVRIWDTSRTCELVALAGHTARVRSICSLVGSGSAKLVTAGDDETVRIWDVATRTLERTLEEHTDIVHVVCSFVGSDGTVCIASAGDDEMIRVWDASTGASIAELGGDQGGVRALCALVDATGAVRLASGGDDAIVHLWNIESGREIATLHGHADRVRSICVIHDDSGCPRLASASDDETVRMWDLDSHATLAVLIGHTSPVGAIDSFQASDGSERLVTASYDDTVRVWDPRPDVGRPAREWPHEPIAGVCAINDPVGGPRLATAIWDDTVRIWDASDATCAAILRGHTNYVADVCTVVVDGRERLVSASWDSMLRVWDPATGTCVAELEGHKDWVVAVCAILIDGEARVVSASSDNTLRVWDPRASIPIATLLGHAGPVRDVCSYVDLDGAVRIASASDDGSVRIWDPRTSDELMRCDGHNGIVRSVCWFRDSAMRPALASAGEDGTIRIWDTRHGDAIGVLRGHKDWIVGVTAVESDSGTGSWLASASDDETLRLWDPTSGDELARISLGTQPSMVREVAGALAVGVANRLALFDVRELVGRS